MKRKKNVGLKFVDGIPIEPTSSLNDYYMCVCSRKYTNKLSLIKHIGNCNGINNAVVCHWCKVEFKNRGNLVTHAFYMHGDKSVKKKSAADNKVKHECEGCGASFTDRLKLKYHIRRNHFNLWARIPHAEGKLINQVWFERVQNTNLIMQIQKTALNTLVMKPLPPDASVEIHDNYKRLDLRSYYPITPSRNEELCKICFTIYRKVDLQKHINEVHFNLTKHKCNNCNQTFKRSYVYLQHVCHKKGMKRKRKVKGVKQAANSSIKITSVESLDAVVID